MSRGAPAGSAGHDLRPRVPLSTSNGTTSGFPDRLALADMARALGSGQLFTLCIDDVYSDAMTVAHVLLGVLAEGPAHGYDLKRAHDERFPAARPLAFGQVYTALAKLERDGLVEVAETLRDGGPERTTYALREEGRSALTDWLAQTEPAGPYSADDLVRKTVTALRLGADAEGFLRRQRMVHLEAMKRLLELQEASDDLAARIVIDHTINHLDADLRWLESAAERVGNGKA